MPKQRLDGEGNIRLRSDGRYEVRISGGVYYATGERTRISRYGAGGSLRFRLQYRECVASSNGVDHAPIY